MSTLTLPIRLADRPLKVEQVLDRWFRDDDGELTVSRRWAMKHLPRHELSPRVIRFYADEIELFLASRSVPAPARRAA